MDQRVETVIFTIEIIEANPGAWYKNQKGMHYDCILTTAQLGFHAPEICYQVLGKFEPVKYIRLWHGLVISQKIADQKSLLKKYLV